MNGLLFGLVLKMRVFGTRKWSIMLTKCFQVTVIDRRLKTKFYRDPRFTRHPNLK